MKPIAISVAQTLKPVDDTRAFEKIACALVKANNFEVNIIGFPSKNLEKKEQKIIFCPLPYFRRLSIRRLSQQIVIWKILKRQRPKVIIVNTPELLPLTVWFKTRFGSKVIYDIRENHRLNILTQKHYPRLVSRGLAFMIGSMETFYSRFVDFFTLAETCYLSQLGFVTKKPYLILENKLSERYEDLQHCKSTVPKLIFTGNLSVVSGVFQAIEIFEHLQGQIPELTMTIIGHAPQDSFADSLENRIQNLDIVLIGGRQQVAHDQIIHQLLSAHMAIVSYQLNEANQFKIPTKIYEYLGLGIPFISEKGVHWTREVEIYPHCFGLDFQDMVLDEIIDFLLHQRNEKFESVAAAYWKEENELLNRAVANLIS